LFPTLTDRPQRLYRYSKREWLERALQFGEFRLSPVVPGKNPANSEQILPFMQKGGNQDARYLTLSLSDTWDVRLFEIFSDADCCLVIHNTEEFGERIHRAAQKVLPSWAGIDAAMSYGTLSPLGAAFSKSPRDAHEKEWLFAWRPTAQCLISFNPVLIKIGNLEKIAELKQKEV
jgi:hypothetical protein